MDALRWTTINSVFGLLLFANTWPVMSQDPDLAQADFNQTTQANGIVSDSPSEYVPISYSMDSGAVNGCCQNTCEPIRNYVLRLRTGADYFDVPGESLMGGLYGVDLAIPIGGDWGFLGSVAASHISAGTQVLGSLGFLKLPNFAGNSFHDPVSFSVLFDQFTDTRVDADFRTMDDDRLYLAQMRMHMGYALEEDFEFGVLYTEPVSRDDSVSYLVTPIGFPTSFTVPGTLEQAQSFAGYVSGNLGDVQVTGQIGFREEPDTLTLQNSYRIPVSDQVVAFANAGYAAERGTWGAAFGVEIRSGRSPNSRMRSYARIPRRHTVVRAQSPDAPIILAQRKGTEVQEIPPSLLDSIPFNQISPLNTLPDATTSLGQQDQPFIGPLPMPDAWAARFDRWHAQGNIFISPGQFWQNTKAGNSSNEFIFADDPHIGNPRISGTSRDDTFSDR